MKVNPATTRGERSLDQFFTAEWAAERLIERYFPDLGLADYVVDAGCGRGPFLKAIPAGIPAVGVEIDEKLAIEARENTGRDVLVGDFRTVALPVGVNTIVGNPPFSRAIIEEFIARGRNILPENGRCGFILPSSFISFSSTLERLMEDFSVRTDILPRDLFPRISCPISFFMFTKERVRRHHGFVLFDEAREISGMPKLVKLALYRGQNRRSPWHSAVTEALRILGGVGTLEAIYAIMQGKRPRAITTWKDTIRRVLQEGGFCNVARGRWSLPAAA